MAGQRLALRIKGTTGMIRADRQPCAQLVAHSDTTSLTCASPSTIGGQLAV